MNDYLYDVYLAGPMTGIADNNFPAFNHYAAALRARGLTVFSPAETSLSAGLTLREYLAVDLPVLCQSRMVALLPGWNKSNGACAEFHVAGACHIERREVRELLKSLAAEKA